MIAKLEAKKRILEDALQSAYRDLGEAVASYRGSEDEKQKVLDIQRKMARIDTAIEECKAVEHIFYATDVPVAEVPPPIPAAPEKVSTDDIPF